MTSKDFCLWLRGFLEISRGRPEAVREMTPSQLRVVHEQLVLVSDDPEMVNLDKYQPYIGRTPR